MERRRFPHSVKVLSIEAGNPLVSHKDKGPSASEAAIRVLGQAKRLYCSITSVPPFYNKMTNFIYGSNKNSN